MYSRGVDDRWGWFPIVIGPFLLVLVSCANPQLQTRSDAMLDHPRLTPESVVMRDGYVLPMKTWPSAEAPVATVLALHGFNDYSHAFESVAQHFAKQKITTYAIDQRGFGRTTQHGVWPGHDLMQSDLVATVDLLCTHYPDLPLFLLGESMGGAVIISAADALEDSCIQGVILSAPAVWGWETMSWWQGLMLRLAAHTLPELAITGEGLDIKPSDNAEMLQALDLDPLIIKATRIDALYGLTDLMDAALANSASMNMPALILYGKHDEIIPPKPICQMLEMIPDKAASDWRMLHYADGYHMLSRDLQGSIVISDMAAWIHNRESKGLQGNEVRSCADWEY